MSTYLIRISPEQRKGASTCGIALIWSTPRSAARVEVTLSTASGTEKRVGCIGLRYCTDLVDASYPQDQGGIGPPPLSTRCVAETQSRCD